MREMINYMLEANLALLLFLAFYKIFLAGETNFRLMRFFMLAAILISLAFPLIHLNNNQEAMGITSIGNVVPAYWLPEIIISGGENGGANIVQSNPAYDIWQFAGWTYALGVVICFTWLINQLQGILLTMRKAPTYQLEKFKVIEDTEDKPTFSFFNLIYIGKANALTPFEKQQIIIHETEHARQLHSVDILLVTVLGVIFWFNPFIRLYKKIFIQLHEFEADARAVENSDMNKYCSLLAKVALQSADLSLASHFTHSLTLKRIAMMRTIKKKIKPWKVIVIAATFPLCFFFTACQDQVMNGISKSTITQTTDYPPEVKADMDIYMKTHSGEILTYVEGRPEEIDNVKATLQTGKMIVNTYSIKKDGVAKKGLLFSNITKYAKQLQDDEQVFTIVEEATSYKGGYDAFLEFIRSNTKYPEAARKAGIKGTVYTQFVVNQDGSLADLEVIKGVDPSLDSEALRVLKLMPAWNPAKQNGQRVRQRFVVPFTFDPGFEENKGLGISEKPYKMQVILDGVSGNNNNQSKIIVGTVLDDHQKPLSGANIIIAGTTNGTHTDADGKFKIEVPNGGKLVFSYIGFETETKDL